jgi:arylformamidase
MTWIDVTMPVRDGMVHWPGDPPVEVTAAGDGSARVSRLVLSSHTGTHIDAPAHYLADGATLDELPLDALIGPARVIQVDGDTVTAADVAGARAGERLLIRTRNSARPPSDQFDEGFVALGLDAAEHLAALPVRCVGVDYLSVGGFHDDGPAIHRALLARGVWIVEGLMLAGVTPGDYELVCLPLRLAGGDGAPARALLRRSL